MKIPRFRKSKWWILHTMEASLTRCAREAGYDSISFRTSRPDPPNVSCVAELQHCRQRVTTNGTMSTWGHVGLYELMSVHMHGSYACGNNESGRSVVFMEHVRSGWQASRPCVCDPRSQWLNCDGGEILPPSRVCP